MRRDDGGDLRPIVGSAPVYHLQPLAAAMSLRPPTQRLLTVSPTAQSPPPAIV